MAKTLERRKSGYTRNGRVRIVSLSYNQLTELYSKTTRRKTQDSIRRRMTELEQRPGFVRTTVEEPVAE